MGYAAGLLVFVLAIGIGRDARADASVTALVGQSCAGTRAAKSLGCTSNDFTTSTTFTQPSQTALSSCVAGSTVTLDIIAALTSHSPVRYDGAIFLGESGNDPSINDSTKSCGLGVFPTTPTPFQDTDGDVCGDFASSATTNFTVTGLKVLCQAAPGTNVLGLPFTLVFDNQAATGCTSANVTAASNAKCVTGTSAQQVTGVTVQGYVKLTKATNPTGQTQSFMFNASSGTTPSPATFSLSEGQSQTVTVPLSTTGGTVSLQLDETALSGWNSTSIITCTTPSGGSASSYVTVNPANRRITATLSATNFGANCTITNEKLATVVINEQTTGGTGSFSFGTGTNGMPSSLSLNTATTNPTSSSAYIVTANNTATALTQTLPTGWALTSASCTDGTSTFGSLSGTTLTIPSANVTAGKTITCTFVNDKLATVAVTQATNGGTGSFSFGSGTNGLPSSLTLNTASTNPISSSPYIVTANGASAAVTQTLPSGWVLSSASCSDGTTSFGTLSGGTITIPAANITSGKVITCTFTNNKLATITVTQQSTGGTGSFSFGSGTNGLPASLTLNTATSNPISSTAYIVTANGSAAAITHTVPSGWILSGATCSDGSSSFGMLAGSVLTIPAANVATGKAINCTFTDEKLATVTIAQQSTGGTGTFSFGAGTNGLPSSLTLNTATSNPISSTAYVVTANGASAAITQTAPSGWGLSSASCSDGTSTFGTLSSSTLTIPAANVAAGKAITCTFVDDKRATITITEQSLGGTGSFTFGSGTNGLPSSFTLNTATSNPISSTAYTLTANGAAAALTQTLPAGWTLTAASCTDGTTTFGTLAGTTLTVAAINVVAGKSITCTFTNTGNASLTKAFSPTGVTRGTASTLTFTITNSSGSPAQSSIGFTDTFPSNLLVASPLTTSNTCGGTLYRGGTTTALVAGDTSIKLSGGAFAAGVTSCTVTVKVSSTTAGTYTNGAAQISGTVGLVTTGMSDQTLTVYGLPNILMVKSADRSTAKPGDVVTYTLQVQNAGAGPATTVVLLDPLSPYVVFAVDAYGTNTPFQFLDGSPSSGLSLGTPQYSSDGGATWTLTPASGGGGAASGYDKRVSAWRITMNGTMAAGTQFTVTFKVAVR